MGALVLDEESGGAVMAKTVGYIVCGWTHAAKGQPMWVENRKTFRSLNGLLYYGRIVTIFPTRKAAKEAVSKTLKHLAEMGQKHTERDFDVCRVETN